MAARGYFRFLWEVVKSIDRATIRLAGRITNLSAPKPGLSARPVAQHMLGTPCATFLQSSQGRGVTPIFWQAFAPRSGAFTSRRNG